MAEPIHSLPNEPFDPSMTYAPCCHPRIMAIGTVLRDTYEAYMSQQRALQASAEAERMSKIETENAAQAARVAAAMESTNGN